MQRKPSGGTNTINFQRILTDALATMDVEINPEQHSKLKAYWLLLQKWNSAYNLSSIRDPKEMIYKHVLDSLTLVPHIHSHALQLSTNQPSLRCADIGSGAGLPGIILAICFPQHHFCLVDSAGKKIRFLFQAKTELGLTNISLENNRVEQFTPEHRFDIVFSRAFASVKKFTDLCEHLLAEQGQFWAMKGVFPEQELSEMEKHYIVAQDHRLSFPGLEGERCLIQIQKVDAS